MDAGQRSAGGAVGGREVDDDEALVDGDAGAPGVEPERAEAGVR